MKRKSKGSTGPGLPLGLVALCLAVVPSAALGSGLCAGLVLCAAGARPAYAASAKVVERVADGKVVNKVDEPISGAVVFMKDTHSQAIRTYICDQEGHFHFGQLGQKTDYEIWAESNGVRSKSKSISSFDSKDDYNFVLKINATK